EPAGQVVAPLRDAHLQGPGRTAVELRRPAGSRPSPAGRAPVLDVEQPAGHEPVEMELGHMPGDADPGRRLVPADGPHLPDDEVVEPPPCRFRQRRQPNETIAEVLTVHDAHPGSTLLSEIWFDETVGCI